jgi:hypothetical protein
MQHSVRSRLRPLRHVVVISVVAIAVLVIGTAQAVATDWTGNGAEGGFCNNVTEDASVPAGMQQWLFILTPPVTNGPGTLTATFDTGSVGPVTGVVQGNGAVHFTVLTPAGAQLLSASTTATGNNLVVSHCEVGPTPETTTTTTGEVTTPTTAAKPPAPSAPAAPAARAPAAVAAAPRVTG